jgi:hypothetical protein
MQPPTAGAPIGPHEKQRACPYQIGALQPQAVGLRSKLRSPINLFFYFLQRRIFYTGPTLEKSTLEIFRNSIARELNSLACETKGGFNG